MATRTLKHGLTDQDLVRKAIDDTWAANLGKLEPFSPTITWKDSRTARLGVTVMAKALTADMTISDDEVRVEAKVPFIFSHFEDRILSTLVERLETSLAAARDKQARP